MWYLSLFPCLENGKARFFLGLAFESLGRDDDAIDIYRDYPLVERTDHYRKAIAGRLDWIVRRKVLREVQMALMHEESLDITEYPENSIAVLYFMNLSDNDQWQPLQKGLAEMMITDLSQVEELNVIERIRVNQLMQELQLGQSGLVDEALAPRMGKLLGARNLIKGSYMIMPDRNLTLDAGIYNIEDVYTPELASMDGNLARLFRIEKELVLRILDHFEISLTPQERERILKIPTENMLAFINYCRGLDALDESDYSMAAGYFRQAVKMDMNFQLAHDHLMTSEMWNALHGRNAIRVSYDVASMIARMPTGRREPILGTSELVSTYTRLKEMGAYQNAGFLPGNDSRKTFQEAQTKGAPVIPDRLVGPPTPPANDQ